MNSVATLSPAERSLLFLLDGLQVLEARINGESA